MSLEPDIQTAYEEQEAVETAARELEARIRRIDGAARLMPARAYGKPIDRDAAVAAREWLAHELAQLSVNEIATN